MVSKIMYVTADKKMTRAIKKISVQYYLPNVNVFERMHFYFYKTLKRSYKGFCGGYLKCHALLQFKTEEASID